VLGSLAIPPPRPYTAGESAPDGGAPLPPQARRTLTAYLQLGAVSLLWGGNFVAAKVLLRWWPPLGFAGSRIALAALLLGAVATARGQRWRLGRSWLWLGAAGALGIGLNNGLLYSGLEWTSAAHGSLIMALAPVGTALALRLAGLEPLTRGRILAVFLGFAGAALIVWPVGEARAVLQANAGDALVFAAMLASSASYVFLRRGLEDVDALSATAVTLGIGALVLLPAAAAEPGPQAGAWTPGALALYLASALLSMGLGMLWWNGAVSAVGAGRTVIFSDVVPAFTLALGAVFLHAPVTWRDLVGFALIAAALVANVLPDRSGGTGGERPVPVPAAVAD
jgi:drug/metabolite transporter (DMT)-like permease